MGFCAMASLGLPGLAGFWGEFPAILSAYNPAGGLKVETFRIFMVVAAVGTVLAAGYLLWLYQRAFFGDETAFVVEAEHHGHVARHPAGRVHRLDAAAHRDPRARHLPEHPVPGARPCRGRRA